MTHSSSGRYYYFTSKGKKVQYVLAVNGKYPMTQLRSVTCHMWSHSVTCHPTQV